MTDDAGFVERFPIQVCSYFVQYEFHVLQVWNSSYHQYRQVLSEGSDDDDEEGKYHTCRSRAETTPEVCSHCKSAEGRLSCLQAICRYSLRSARVSVLDVIIVSSC